MARLSMTQGIIEEGDEDDESDEDYEPAETSNHLDVPAALSHALWQRTFGLRPSLPPLIDQSEL